MNIHKTRFLVSLLVLAMATLACGGGDQQNSANPQETTSQAAPAPVQREAESTPKALGDKIGDIYVQAMSGLVTALKDKPAASEVQDQIASMREEYIQKLVELGRKREALDESGRSAVDLAIRMKARSFSRDDFNLFNDIQQHYFSEREFHKIIMSFNVITQYASFDLLKKQEPEEAARLGIQ